MKVELEPECNRNTYKGIPRVPGLMIVEDERQDFLFSDCIFNALHHRICADFANVQAPNPASIVPSGVMIMGSGIANSFNSAEMFSSSAVKKSNSSSIGCSRNSAGRRKTVDRRNSPTALGVEFNAIACDISIISRCSLSRPGARTPWWLSNWHSSLGRESAARPDGHYPEEVLLPRLSKIFRVIHSSISDSSQPTARAPRDTGRGKDPSEMRR